MLALISMEQQTCRCGGWLPETTDPENEGKYHALPPSRCHKCDAMYLNMKRYDDDPARVIWPVEKR